MADESYSLSALRQFLRQSPMQGLINPAAARSRLNAVDQLDQEMSEAETRDVRRIDVDELIGRFHKLEGESIRPETLDIYAQRLRAALTDFLSWRENPDGFSSVGQERVRAVRRNAHAASRSADEQEGERILLQASDNRTNIVPVPIRDDTTVYVANLPLDLTREEAGRITRVVRAFARDGNDGCEES